VADFAKRYELVERIGSGGAGDVWLAHDERLGGRPVAIKIMHRSVLPDSDDVARFEHEMRVAARLDHPNIVTIYTTGTCDDAPFTVMEYLEGQDLAMTLPDGDPERVAAIGRGICAALAYAHGQGVIHGDIKPGNMVLRDTGQVKVTDFGLARAVSGTAPESSEVRDGKLPYLSPGQWRGEAPAFSDDIWSVGCVLYRHLSGRLPRVLPGAADYTAAARRGDPVPDLRPVSAAPEWLTSAVMAMLEPDPASRATAGDCVRLLSGAPSPASVPGRSRRSRLLPGQADPGGVPVTATVAAQTTAAGWRRPGRVLSASAVALVLLLAGSITAWQFDTAPGSSRPTLSRVVTHTPASGTATGPAPSASAVASWSGSAATVPTPASAPRSGRPAASPSRVPSASPSRSVSASPSASPAASASSSPSASPSSPPSAPPSGPPTASPPPGGPPPGGPPPGGPPPGGPPSGGPPPGPPSARPPR